jgi:NADPH:quinone reductase-like Zn-dependent oxidoreductase
MRMRAVVFRRYGSPDVLQPAEVETPVPASREILIRTRAATVTSADWRVRSLTVPVGFGLLSRLAFGVFGPRQPILGSEIAGEVEAVGRDVTAFQVGDQVFAFRDARMGCHAEYVCMPEDGAVAHKPAALSHDEAAALSFGGTTALDFFRRGALRSGERVLVNGASGAVGTAAVQLARHAGAEVTGVCSTGNVDLVRSLGATHVIDYTREDFTRNGRSYDVIMDTAGTAPYARSKGSLREGGRLLMVLGGLPDMLLMPWVSMTSSRSIIAAPAAGRAEDLRLLARLAEAGAFRPVIDRRYPFEQIAEAHRYVETGRKRGNVVITLDPDAGVREDR